MDELRGPGSYELQKHETNKKKHEGIRLGPTFDNNHDIKQSLPTPGPGQYEPKDKQIGSKKSFNLNNYLWL